MDEGVCRIRWINDDDAPTGRMNEWTSPMVILGKTAMTVVRMATGWPRQRADDFCRVWLGPAVALATLAVVAGMGRAAGGWALAGCWAIAWPVPYMIVGMTCCGNVNHQGFHLFLFALCAGLCIAGREQARRSPNGSAGAMRWGAALGLANAVAIWAAASELLPICVLTALLAAWDCAHDDANRQLRRFWRGWWIYGLLGTAAALLFEFGPGSPPGGPGLLHNHLEFISIWDVGLWVLAAIGVEWLRRWRISAPWRFGAWGAGSVILALVSAAALRHFMFFNLHVVQDPRFTQLVFAVSEFQPFFSAQTAGLAEFGLLPLVLLLLIRRRASAQNPAPRNRRTTWAWLGVLTAVFLLLTLYEYRWAAYFATALVMLAGYAAAHRWPRRPIVALGIIAVAVAPIWVDIFLAAKNASLHGDLWQGPYVSHLGLEMAGRDISAALGSVPPGPITANQHGSLEDRRPIVLTSWTWGGYLAGDGYVRVVGSQYWSNLDGYEDTLRLFSTTSDEEFYRLCERRQISLALIPDPRTMIFTIAQACAARSGIWPKQERVFATALWRLASDPTTPTVPSPHMSQVEPQWRIVQISTPPTPSQQ
jgi:hypothetical protein